MKQYLHYLAAALPLANFAVAQKAGSQQTETHPKLTWSKCTGPGACTTVNAEVVIDSNWRWLHDADQKNCYDGNEWTSSCSTADDCAELCELEGADYDGTYGASTSGDALSLSFLTKHEYGTNIGSRFYLMDGSDKYQMFNLLGNEFAFDVDLSTVECGLNSALYFVAMEEDGGLASYPSNTAGAKYGTGYCDAQCARDLKFVGGKGNIEGWKPSTNDPNAGVGPMGGCCAEIDVWSSNAYAFAFTPHGCENNDYHVCEESTCGGTYSEDRYGGDCDANGCDYNPYRMGHTDFYGPGLTVDTSKVFTVVTQFEENKLTQFFVQDGQKIEIPAPTWEGLPTDSSSITPELCSALFTTFDDRDRYSEVGGFDAINDALSKPLVLVMSIWDDHYSNMLWLDSSYPPEKAGTPGGDRGPCGQDTGVPADVESQFPDAKVIWSNIRFGPLGSTTE
ncbi:glycoside hydrolase [Dichotomopilus funicola]|uniref:Glucanase n=1 Tax=Dichotomopilus funicola TaxID=1934379 RepID=A0AAN6UU12_9PEZI|nr:glycoside hydrolase [Dichotomopilus funicola]